MSDLQMMLTKMLMPSPKITVTIYTVGGVDENGNEVEEPTVFDGYKNEAIEFFGDEDNLSKINRILDDMWDGYIMVEVGEYSREVYDVYEIMDVIDEMIY